MTAFNIIGSLVSGISLIVILSCGYEIVAMGYVFFSLLCVLGGIFDELRKNRETRP